MDYKKYIIDMVNAINDSTLIIKIYTFIKTWCDE